MIRPKFWLLGIGIVLEFATILAILLKIFPKPMKQTDYLVVGTLATFVALGTLFGILLATTMRDPTAFKKTQATDSLENEEIESAEPPGKTIEED